MKTIYVLIDDFSMIIQTVVILPAAKETNTAIVY
jgi:hypothetical protein